MKMKLLSFGIILSLASLLTPPTHADVDRESIFKDARVPASMLDLKFQDIRRSWYEIFIKSPKDSTAQKYPLIVRSGVEIELFYSGVFDKIEVIGWINKLEGFLTLTLEQRKRLLSEVLSAIQVLLFDLKIVDKETGSFSTFLKKQHIRLHMIVGGVMFDEKGKSIRLSLPHIRFSVGQAGYEDGEFIFSHDYYLHLRIKNGLAVSGDPQKFVIEKEQ